MFERKDLQLDRQLGSGIPRGAERPIKTNSYLPGEIFLIQMAFKQEKNRTIISI